MKRADIFKHVKLPGVQRNRFDLSHDVKMSFRMGELVPSCVVEVLPGDSFRIQVQNMLRFLPLVSPVMHRIKVTSHFFFVPNRILYPEWETFITTDTDSPGQPYIQVAQGTGVTVGSLLNYLGVPPWNDSPSDLELQILAYPLAAYCKIFDEYYRDENLVSEFFTELEPGDNTSNYVTWFSNRPLRRAWNADYFTKSLPFAQKGDAVQIPLTSQDDIPVDYTLVNSLSGTWRTLAGVAFGDGPVLQDSGNARVNTGSPTDAIYDPRRIVTGKLLTKV